MAAVALDRVLGLNLNGRHGSLLGGEEGADLLAEIVRLARVDHAARVHPPGGTREVGTIVTLEIPPQSEPIILVVDGMRFIGGPDERDDPDEGDRYYYEEHSCTESILRACASVSIGDNEDPHGLVRYVRTDIVDAGD